MKVKDLDNLVFETTGHGLNANLGFIGINSDLELSEGYDGGLFPHDLETREQIDDEHMNPAFTKEEKKELADFMCSLWRQWENKP